jgi:hypothetical protein
LEKNARSIRFYALLHDIEWQIGNECYNGNIQNFGPGGVWEGEGREFRYPVTFINKGGQKEKYTGKLPFTESSSGEKGHCVLGDERYQSAYYAFGANQLYILRGIRKAIEDLEARFGLDFEALLDEERLKKAADKVARQ